MGKQAKGTTNRHPVWGGKNSFKKIFKMPPGGCI
jgi:hypothetical protein